MAIFAALMPERTFARQFNQDHLKSLKSIAGADNVLHFESLDTLRTHPEASRIHIILTGWGAPCIEPSILRECPSLALVAHCAGSLRTVFDPALYEHGVRTTSSAAANAIPVAEFLLSWVLRWNKRLPYWEAGYQHPELFGQRGAIEFAEIGNRNKAIGIISASRVGRQFAKLLQPFDLQILIFDPFQSEEKINALGARKVSLAELLCQSDIVSINAPLLPDTRHMIGSTQLTQMRDGALLINTARGEIVDHEALLPELQSGRLNAVLDVTWPEPLPDGSPFFALPNAFITPHVAGSLGYEIHRMTESTLSELASFVSSGQLEHEVFANNWETVA